MNVAILGAGGFIGCNLIPYLKDKGHYVVAVDIEFPEFREPQWTKADVIVRGDLRNYANVLDSLTHNIDWVIQLAADMGGVGYFHGGHDYYPYLNSHQINLNVLRAVEDLAIPRLFFAASACVYPIHINDNLGSPLLTEDMIYPANCDMNYGWEKLMMMRLCENAPFDARVGIFDTIYGPYQEMNGERMKFPTAIATKVLAKKDMQPIDIWGDGTQQRMFLYIDDALEKIYSVLSTDNYTGPVNICSNEMVTIKQIADICCEIADKDKQYNFQLDKPVGVLSRRSSDEKWNKDYGIPNKVGPEEGFRRLIKWLRTENK